MAIILVPLEDTFDQWRIKANALSIVVGDFDNLDSTESSLVQAINENFNNIGDLSTLTTDTVIDLVSAINEVDLHTDTNTINIGDMPTLTTQDKTTLVNAINELDDEIGDLSGLTTDSTSNLVAAINEVDLHTDTNETNIGDMNLDTTATNLTDAINEHEADIGDMVLTTTATDLTDAINEHDTELGNVGGITTDATDVAGAINEHDAEIGEVVMGTTATTLTGAIAEHGGEIGDMALDTTATDLTEAINEHETDIGDMALDTSATDLTEAINEVAGEVDTNTTNIGTNTTNIGTMANLTTSATTDLVVAVNSLSDIAYLGQELNEVTDLNSLLVYGHLYGPIDDVLTPVADTDYLLENYFASSSSGVTTTALDGEITIPTTGIYEVQGNIMFACTTVSCAYQLSLDNDATKNVVGTLYNGSTDSGVAKTINFRRILSLTASDVLSLYLKGSAIGVNWTNIKSYFSVIRIS